MLSLYKIGGARQYESKLSLRSLALSLYKIGGARQSESKLSLRSLALSLSLTSKNIAMDNHPNIIIYRTTDGKASVALYAADGKVWLNQQQMAELFATSKSNISMHISNILKERELDKNSVVKKFLTTATDGKTYNVVFYSLEMIIAVGYRVRGVRGTQFRQWATEHLTE